MKAIIFDFDETIIRSYKDHIDSFLITSKKFGCDIKKEEICKRLGKSAKGIINELLKLKKSEVSKFVEEKEKTYRKLVKKRGIKTVKGIKSLLNFLKSKKMKIAICSSASLKNILLALKKTSLKNYFDVIIGLESVKRAKPHPEPLLKTAKALNENPENCIYIGDSIYEMQAAKKVGIKTIGILTGFYNKKELKKSGADYVCKNLIEVKNLLQSLI